jgi:toxin-antitoxin system PIN domain toxin
VILVDANVLVYAHSRSFSQHEAARIWLDERLNGRTPIGLPWPSLLAFVRVMCNPRVLDRPRSPSEAWNQVEAWLDCPPAWIPLPTERHRETLGALLRGSAVPRGNLVADAHLAALAVEHGLTLCSTDGDFARFPGLRWENPLA